MLETEQSILLQISRIANSHRNFHRAVERIAAVLEREADGKAFMVELPGAEPNGSLLTTSADIQDFLASIESPYRSLFYVPLRDGGEEIGKLIACFASDKFQGDLPRRLAEFAGEQIGMLLARSRLTSDNEARRNELASLKAELSARKSIARAQGHLISREGLNPQQAIEWLTRQSAKTGLPIHYVADRVTDLYLHGSLPDRKTA
jgi:GAF domain-containing protein